jgi:putative transposase
MAKSKHNFDIWAYVFMPNHVHILVWPKDAEYLMSNILKTIKQSLSRRIILYLKKNNPGQLKILATNQKRPTHRFWMDGSGYDRNIISQKALINSVNYIHNNPIRKGLVTKPEDWKWSSFREWHDLESSYRIIDKDTFPSI